MKLIGQNRYLIPYNVDCEPLNKSKNILRIVVAHGTSHPK